MFECPNCREEVKDGARKCPHCQEWLIALSAQDKAQMPTGDRIELAELRAAENVRTAVEQDLKKRYMWVGLIVAALTGGTITLVVKSNVDSALLGTQQKLAVAEALEQRNLKALDDFDKVMLRMGDLDKSLNGLTKSASETQKEFADLQTSADSLRKDQFASSKDVLDVARRLDDKISILASAVKELNPNKIANEEIEKLIAKSQTIKPVLARAEKRQYAIKISNFSNVDQLVNTLTTKGYSVSIYNSGVGVYEPADWQVMWIGKDFPYDFANDVITTAFKFFPTLRYIEIRGDFGSSPGDETRATQLYIGATTTWAKSYGLKPLDERFYSSLASIGSQEALHTLIRSYYGTPAKE